MNAIQWRGLTRGRAHINDEGSTAIPTFFFMQSTDIMYKNNIKQVVEPVEAHKCSLEEHSASQREREIGCEFSEHPTESEEENCVCTERRE